MITLADDSGLSVDSLNGAPGVLSARYGGENLSDEDREIIKKLLDLYDRFSGFLNILEVGESMLNEFQEKKSY